MGTQGNILIDAYRASNLVGATPTGRPEDVEVHPLDKSIYIAFTANATAQNSLFTNIYGELVRIVEGSADGTGHDVHVAALEGRRPQRRHAGRATCLPRQTTSRSTRPATCGS